MGGSEDLVLFLWERPDDGFRWVKAKAVNSKHAQNWLLAGGGPKGTGLVTRYNPLKETQTLFRQFAETEGSQEGIRHFAEKFGPLGVRKLLAISEPLPFGESYSVWARAIVDMRQAVDVWDAITAHEYSQLRGWFKVTQATKANQVSGAVFERDGRYNMFVTNLAPGALWPYVKDADLRQPKHLLRVARFFVQIAVNKGMGDHAAPRLFYNAETDSPELHIAPKNLLGAMWMQLARAVDGSKDYRRCQHCQEWFEVSIEGMRPQARYCSDQCRVRAHRAKQTEARRLAGEGIPIRKIARTLNTTVKVVRGWVDAGKK